jgi:DNA-binding NtrC family response regulator
MFDPVLFVDDDFDLRELMEMTLVRAGARRVVTAGSLFEVQEQRDAVLACQLAILDINLGIDQPNGVEVHHWLGREGFVGKIVFLTGHAANDPQVKQAASVAGSQIASKPLSVAQVRGLIEAPAM